MNVIDLTGTIEEGMWLDNPWIPAPTIELIASIDGPAGWEAHRLTLATILGTYIEASAHLIREGETIDEVSPERFIRPAAVIQLPDLDAGEAITRQALAVSGICPRPGDALLVSTGWDRRWNQPGFVEDSPYFTLEAMQWMIDTSPAIIGADIPCFDHPNQPNVTVRLLFDNNCLLLAPLVNLRAARRLSSSRMWLAALPIKIKGVCGTPCRALLFVID